MEQSSLFMAAALARGHAQWRLHLFFLEMTQDWFRKTRMLDRVAPLTISATTKL